jgi:uncharacterized protein
MTIIALTDIHARTKALTTLAAPIRSADLVLLCGDITHFGHRKEMEDILHLVTDLNPSVFAVSGNCDYPDAEKLLFEKRLSLNGLTRTFQGFTFFGLSGSLPCPGKTPNEYEEEEYEAILDGLTFQTGEPLLMVSHQPPCGTLNDQVSPGMHVGSKTIRNFIERKQPLICFTGHIHEGTGIDHIGITAIVNPGPAGNGSYVRVEITAGTIKNLEVLQSFHG